MRLSSARRVTGKVENCVTWVFAALVTALGQAWIDFDVYMPETWAKDPERRRRAGIPDSLKFATKPELATAQVKRLAAAGLRFCWVAADEVYGRCGEFRGACRALKLAYVVIIPCDYRITILVVNSGLCGEAEFQACQVAGSLPVQRRAGPVGLQPEQVQRAGHVHVVQAGLGKAAVAGAPRAVAGGLVHGALDAGVAGVTGLERDRCFCRTGGGLGFGQVAGRHG